MQPTTAGDQPGVAKTFTLLFFFLFFTACHSPTPKVAVSITEAVDTTAAITKHPADTIKKNPRKKKKVYITFDDGPNKGTKNVLDIVKDEKVPVTFFVVGEHVFASYQQKQLWDSLQMADHIAICNHSFSHARHRYGKYYQQPDSVVKDFVKTHDTLHLNNTIARTPGRNIWRLDTLVFTDIKASVAAADSLASAGFVLMGWDLEWHYDHKTMTVMQKADEMVQQIDSAFGKRQTRMEDHLVLLAHDQVYVTSDDSSQLRSFLQKLKMKDEYELALVTTYPGALRRMKTDSFKTKITAP